MASGGWRLEQVRYCTFCALTFLIVQFIFAMLWMRYNAVNNLFASRLRIPNRYASLSDKKNLHEFLYNTPNYTDDYYQYNRRLSDMLGVIRQLPDARDESCNIRTYRIPHSSKAKVSVIISYHNESRSMLLRTIISLISRTPEDYLHELIIIDDFSDDVNLQRDLRTLMDKIYATRGHLTLIFRRNSRRMGMIWSRNKGVSEATGHYLFFLDSHCEVNDGWLEPLLDRLVLNSTRAVSPLVDPIDPMTFSYQQAENELLKGGFDWNLHFHWLPRHMATGELPQQAYLSPTFAGGILMISREWLLKLQGFNPHLQIWGGESIELAIKLWLCGGQIEIVPCSRIGHIYRSRHAFQFPTELEEQLAAAQETYLRNSKIIAESWLDEYKYLFYSLKPKAKDILWNTTDQGYDVVLLKRKLQCQPFDWYLHHVFTELNPNNEDFYALGILRNGDLCVHIHKQEPILANCYITNITNWGLDRKTEQLITDSGYCLSVALDKSDQHLRLEPCVQDKSQFWLRQSTQLINKQTHLCLDNAIKNQLVLSICRNRPTPVSQTFQFALEMETRI